MTPNYDKCFIYDVKHIHFGEFDLGGVLYHARYFHLYETARELLLKDGGVPYTELLKNDTHLLLSESHQNFISPIFYGKEYRLYLWVTDLKKASFTMNYNIIDTETGKTVNKAWTKHAFIVKNGDSFKILSLPENIKKILDRFCAD